MDKMKHNDYTSMLIGILYHLCKNDPNYFDELTI